MNSLKELISSLEKVLKSKKSKLTKQDKETLKRVIENLRIAEKEKNSVDRKYRILKELGLLLRLVGVSTIKSVFEIDIGE